MSVESSAAAHTLDGVTAEHLAQRLALPRVVLLASIGSTLDVAHRMGAEGTPAGTLIVADEQTAGRGRQGKQWTSAPGAGLWLTFVERPADVRALDVLALRCGLFAAEALDPLAASRVGVKWPNDLYVGGRKLAGILIEVRWRAASPEWVAIGMGLNVVAPPDVDTATGLAPGATRVAALERLAPALRRAALSEGPLTDDERARWHARDVLRGLAISSPSAGVVQGITETGELLVAEPHGAVVAHRSGSVTFAEPLPCS